MVINNYETVSRILCCSRLHIHKPDVPFDTVGDSIPELSVQFPACSWLQWILVQHLSGHHQLQWNLMLLVLCSKAIVVSFNTIYFIINYLSCFFFFKSTDNAPTWRDTALRKCILMDIRLTPAPLSLHRLFKSSDWSLCQFHCSSIPSQSYVTNYPALPVLVSVIQSLHQCFQHVSHLCLSDVVCLVVPAHYLSVVEICKLWFTLFLVPSRACSAVYFLVFFFCQSYTFSQCLSSSPPSFFFPVTVATSHSLVSKTKWHKSV